MIHSELALSHSQLQQREQRNELVKAAAGRFSSHDTSNERTTAVDEGSSGSVDGSGLAACVDAAASTHSQAPRSSHPLLDTHTHCQRHEQLRSLLLENGFFTKLEVEGALPPVPVGDTDTDGASSFTANSDSDKDGGIHLDHAWPTPVDTRCHDEAIRLKQAGNEHFAAKQYRQATECYSQALSLSFGDVSLRCSLYTNRSTSLYQLANRIMTHNMTSAPSAAITSTTTTCDAILTCAERDCDAAMDEANNHVHARVAPPVPAPGEKAAKRRDIIREYRHKLRSQRRHEMTDENVRNIAPMLAVQSIPSPDSASPSPNNLHPAVAIHDPPIHPHRSNDEKQTEDDRGRCVIANQIIDPGTTILTEQCYAAVLKDAYRPKLPRRLLVRRRDDDDEREVDDGPTTATDSETPKYPISNLNRCRCQRCFVPLRVQLPPDVANAVNDDRVASIPSSSIPWFIPCSSCPLALYCSISCRDHDRLTHMCSCTSNGVESQSYSYWRFMARLAEQSRLAIQILMRSAREERQVTDERDGKGEKQTPGNIGTDQSESAQSSSSSQCDPSLYSMVHSLLTHIDKMPSTVMVEYEFQAAICHEFFQRFHQLRIGCSCSCNNTARKMPHGASGEPEETNCWHVRMIYPLFLHHLCQIRSNAYAITQLSNGMDEEDSSTDTPSQVEPVVRSTTPNSLSSSSSATAADLSTISSIRQLRVALAIFPTGAMFNHSCHPNAFATFRGRQLIVRAVSSVKPGQELCISYGPHRGHHSRATRQKILREEYFFQCHCAVCLNESEHEEFDAFRCQRGECSGALRPHRPDSSPSSASTASSTSPATHTPFICSICHGETPASDIARMQRLAEKARKRCEEARMLMQQEDQLPAALSGVQSILSLYQSILTPSSSRSHRFIAESFDLLGEVHARLTQFHEASACVRLSISRLKTVFGPDSIEVAHERVKLAQLLFHAERIAEARQVAMDALNVLRVYEEESSPYASDEMRELKQMLQVIDRQCGTKAPTQP